MLISSPEDEGGVDQTMVFAKAQPKDEDYSDDDDDEETDGDDQDGDDGEPEENVDQADPADEQDPADPNDPAGDQDPADPQEPEPAAVELPFDFRFDKGDNIVVSLLSFSGQTG